MAQKILIVRLTMRIKFLFCYVLCLHRVSILLLSYFKRRILFFWKMLSSVYILMNWGKKVSGESREGYADGLFVRGRTEKNEGYADE